MCYDRSNLWLAHSSVQNLPASNALGPNRVSLSPALIQWLEPQAGRGLLTAPIPDPTAARFDVAEVAKSGCMDACLPATAGGNQISHRETFDNSLSLNDPPSIDPPNIDR